MNTNAKAARDIAARDIAANEIVITAAGVLTASGDSVEKHVARLAVSDCSAEKRALTGFQPAPYLTDRKTLKAVSPVDAFGLVALEQLKKAADATEYDRKRVGLYVGAPPASPRSNENYFEAMRSSVGPTGTLSMRAFGGELLGARPTTLLLGLPNNVLCYGSILFDAKGPNSNYTSAETSGHLAVINGARRIALGRLDAAVAGAFSGHTDDIMQSILEQNDFLTAGSGQPSSPMADGSVFFLLEKRAAAERRGAKPLATFVGSAQASNASGKFSASEPSDVAAAIGRAAKASGISLDQVGLVFASAMGLGKDDSGEGEALQAVFVDRRSGPAFATTLPLFGNLMEAGGLLEIVLIPKLFELGEVPEAMRLTPNCERRVDASKPYVLVLRTSLFGEATCIVLRHEPTLAC